MLNDRSQGDPVLTIQSEHMKIASALALISIGVTKAPALAGLVLGIIEDIDGRDPHRAVKPVWIGARTTDDQLRMATNPNGPPGARAEIRIDRKRACLAPSETITAHAQVIRGMRHDPG